MFTHAYHIDTSRFAHFDTTKFLVPPVCSMVLCTLLFPSALLVGQLLENWRELWSIQCPAVPWNLASVSVWIDTQGFSCDFINNLGRIHWSAEGGSKAAQCFSKHLVHFRLGYFFWTDFFEDDVKRANLDGSNITTIINSGLGAPGT